MDMFGAACDLELPVLIAGKNRTELSDLGLDHDHMQTGEKDDSRTQAASQAIESRFGTTERQ